MRTATKVAPESEEKIKFNLEVDERLDTDKDDLKTERKFLADVED